MIAPATGRGLETELLLCCARTQLDHGTVSRLQTLLASPLDWQALLQAAARHALTPLLYHHLKLHGAGAVPEPVLERLQRSFRENNLRNLFLAGELGKIVKLLEGRGIEVIPYKGPVLASSIYGNLALRRFVDLDLILREEDVFPAAEVLESAGYRPDSPLPAAQRAAYLRTRYAYELEREDGRVYLELHWQVVPKYFPLRLDTARLWERLERVPLGDTSVPTLTPEPLLLVLCVHGAKHLWDQLNWICDIAELIRAHQDLDWDGLLARARALRGERILALGLFLADDLLGAPLPETIRRRLRADPAVVRLGRRVRQQLGRGTVHAHDDTQLRLAHLQLLDRLSDRLTYCLRIATTPNQAEWGLLQLPAPLAFIYTLLRPPRLLVKHGKRLVRERT